MKKHIVWLFLVCLWQRSEAAGIDVFKAGLDAFHSNRAETLLASWYDPTDKEKIAITRRKFAEATGDLGDVMDTEVFEPKSLGRHIQHLYGVIYFRKSPLWVRTVYYTLGDQHGFLSIE